VPGVGHQPVESGDHAIVCYTSVPQALISYQQKERTWYCLCLQVILQLPPTGDQGVGKCRSDTASFLFFEVETNQTLIPASDISGNGQPAAALAHGQCRLHLGCSGCLILVSCPCILSQTPEEWEPWGSFIYNGWCGC